MSDTAKVWELHAESAGGRRRSLVRQLAASETGAGVRSFSVVLVFDSQGRRDFVRRRLTQQGVSTRVLGPREQPDGSEEDRRLSDRLFFLSCPGGDGESNLARPAALAEEANRQYETLVTPDAPEEGGKGDRHLLPERPSGCCAQKVPVPFSAEPPQRTVERQHDDWPHFISAQSSPVWGHRYRAGIRD